MKNMTNKMLALFLLFSNLLFAQDPALFMEAEISPKESAYAQTPITYSIRLYRQVNLTQASITEPTVNDPDAMIEKLGDDREYQHVDQNGRLYRVIEQRYVVIPQLVGELIFSPVVFEGRILQGGNSFFHTKTQYSRMTSDEKRVTIKPIPSPFRTNNWLPAENVKAKIEWSSDPSKVQLGESITWTLTLTAQGCLAEQIPDVLLPIPSEFKHYQDKPQIENQMSAKSFTGVKKIKVALIPTKPGTISLPEIKIKWWDLKEDKEKETLVPGTTLHIEPGLIADAGDNITVLDTSMRDALTPVKLETQSVIQAQSEPQTLPLWAWALIGLNGIWIIGGVVYLLKKINFKRKKAKPDSKTCVRDQLKAACDANDPKQAEMLLLAWAAQTYPQIKPLNLIEIKKHAPESLQDPILQLYQALYSHKSPWVGEDLWAAFAAFNPKKGTAPKKRPPEELLRKLYT